MNILLINHFPLQGSGSGVYAINIAKSLTKKGHKVCIISPENTIELKEIENVKLHPVFFKYKDKINNQCDFNFPCFDPHPRSDFRFCNMTNEQLKQYMNVFEKAISEEIKSFRPDIIHSQHIWILSKVALKFNLPVVVTSHGSDIMGYELWPQFHNMMFEVVKNSKRIIAISNHSKDDLVNIFKDDKEKIITISNGYDEKTFYKEKYDKQEVFQELGIKKQYNKIVCFAGRLAQNKGVDLLLNVAKDYEKEDIGTLIVGDGEELKNLKQLRDELGLKNIEFLGNRNHEMLRKIYNISDICVVPSRKEAFGLVALEAIACGTPVVATNHGGLPDFVNSKVGILINRDSVNELGQAIFKILNGEIKFDSNYLAQYAVNNYRQDLLIDELIKIYEESIE